MEREHISFEDSIDKMSRQREQIFSKAKRNIKKAQAHYSRNYDSRNAGRVFYIGDKVLKRNMKDVGRHEKFVRKYVGPYTILGKSYTCMQTVCYHPSTRPQASHCRCGHVTVVYHLTTETSEIC